MKINILLPVLFLFCGFHLFAQEEVTLEICISNALSANPLQKQHQYLDEIASLQTKNINKSWLPQVNLIGQATYQNKTIELPIKLPGLNIETPSKDQYKVFADIQQNIYDGGLIASQKTATTIQNAAENKKVENELFKIKEKVIQLYFNALFVDNQLDQSVLAEKDLLALSNKIAAATQNGVSSKYNEAVVGVELEKLHQKQTELKSMKTNIIQSLNKLMNKQFAENVRFTSPIQVANNNTEIKRTELELMQIQQLQLNNLAEIANKKSMPKLGAFGQVGYGRPGLNQLSNSFEGYAIGGLRLSWNLSSLYTLQNEKQVIQLQSKSIDAQKEAFVLQTETNISSQIADIEKYKKLIVSDNQIIEFRKKIKTAAQAMLDNGVTTYQDFLKDLDAEETAKTTKAMHEIQLLQSQYQLQLLFGNL